MNYDTNIDPQGTDAVAHFDPLARTGEDDRQSARRIWVIVLLVIAATIAIWFLTNFTGSEELAGKSADVDQIESLWPTFFEHYQQLFLFHLQQTRLR